MQVDVVIPTLTNSDKLFSITKNCIESLHASEKEIKFRVILVETNQNYYSSQWVYPNDIEVVIPKTPFNYNAYLCYGLELCGSDFVVLANNDLKFYPGWFSEILSAYKYFNEGVKSFSPWNRFTHPQLFHVDAAYYEGYRVPYEIAGWCLVARREIFSQIDFANPVNFRASFHYADSIYADLLQYHSIRHVLVRDSRVDHLRNSTINTFSQKQKKIFMSGQWANYLKGKTV